MAGGAARLVVALSSCVFSCWDLEQLGIPALGSRPQPQCLLRLDLAETLHLGPSAALLGAGAVAGAAGSERDTLCCTLSGGAVVLVSFRPAAATTKKKAAVRGVSCLAPTAPDVALTLPHGVGAALQRSPAVCLPGWPGRLCLLNSDDSGGPP